MTSSPVITGLPNAQAPRNSGVCAGIADYFGVAPAGVRIAAVVGVPHEKWEERPILIIESHDDAEISTEAVLAYLEPQIVKWWMPDAVIFDAVPLTATGKIDKKTLRDRYRDHLLELTISAANS